MGTAPPRHENEIEKDRLDEAVSELTRTELVMLGVSEDLADRMQVEHPTEDDPAVVGVLIFPCGHHLFNAAMPTDMDAATVALALIAIGQELLRAAQEADGLAVTTSDN
jgi:hypothetical protein